jgi:hypothetical protein
MVPDPLSDPARHPDPRDDPQQRKDLPDGPANETADRHNQDQSHQAPVQRGETVREVQMR